MNAEQRRDHLDAAITLVENAGPIAAGYFRSELAVDDKSGGEVFDPVTVADREVERFLRTELAVRFADYAVLGEEEGLTDTASSRRWVIDPIDGTRAFITGMPAWGILLGLMDGDVAELGVMHQPYLGETFFGSLGAGAFLRKDGKDRKLATRRCSKIEDAVLGCTHPWMFEQEEERESFLRLATASRLPRFGGDCYGYCLLAMGLVDLVVEGGLQPYDIVALIPIIEAAGGKVTNRNGEPAVDGGFVVAAGDPELHARALDLLNDGGANAPG